MTGSSLDFARVLPGFAGKEKSLVLTYLWKNRLARRKCDAAQRKQGQHKLPLWPLPFPNLPPMVPADGE
jgi:hypothetical protein